MPFSHISNRALIRVAGEEARSFLQGLVTCDMMLVTPYQAAYGALLTPQGKLLVDFFIVQERENSFLIDLPAAESSDFQRRLTLYKLRANVEIALLPDWQVFASWGDEINLPGITFQDPRSTTPKMGLRHLIPSDRTINQPLELESAYDAHRIKALAPQGGIDFTYGDVFPHDVNLDTLGGVNFKKGCFIGQEVVSRVEHRGGSRKHIIRVALQGEGVLPTPGTSILMGEREIGTLGSSHEDIALALIRIDLLEEARVTKTPVTTAGWKVK